jgi:hypothetical protein
MRCSQPRPGCKCNFYPSHHFGPTYLPYWHAIVTTQSNAGSLRPMMRHFIMTMRKLSDSVWRQSIGLIKAHLGQMRTRMNHRGVHRTPLRRRWVRMVWGLCYGGIELPVYQAGFTPIRIRIWARRELWVSATCQFLNHDNGVEDFYFFTTWPIPQYATNLIPSVLC